MKLDQLKQSWQQNVASANQKGNDEATPSQQHNPEHSMQLIEDKIYRLDKTIKQRSFYGAITFGLLIVGMLLFLYFLYLLNSPLTALIGIASWIVSFAFAVLRLFSLKQSHQIEQQLPIQLSLQQKLNKVKSESRFYSTLVWWLMAPLSGGILLILIGVQASFASSALYFGFFILLSYLGHSHNKRYIAKELLPLQHDLENNLKEF